MVPEVAEDISDIGEHTSRRTSVVDTELGC